MRQTVAIGGTAGGSIKVTEGSGEPDPGRTRWMAGEPGPWGPPANIQRFQQKHDSKQLFTL